MASFDGTIANYWVRFHSGRSGQDGVRAQIILFDPAGRQNGTINFYHDVVPVPALVPGAPLPSRPTMHLPFAAFPAVMDLLRNERPLLISWVDRLNPLLTTTIEPQGEGE